MPTMPGMHNFQMPAMPGSNMMPRGGMAGVPDIQQGVPPPASQVPAAPLPQGHAATSTQPANSQLDAYIAAASAAQQYAQYYQVNALKFF